MPADLRSTLLPRYLEISGHLEQAGEGISEELLGDAIPGIRTKVDGTTTRTRAVF